MSRPDQYRAKADDYARRAAVHPPKSASPAYAHCADEGSMSRLQIATEARENGVRIVVDGEPVPKGRPRIGRGKVYTPARTRLAELRLGWEAKLAMRGREPFSGPVSVRIDCWCTRVDRSDIDNCVKLILDAINEIVWRDDKQVHHLVAAKHRAGDGQAKVVINVTEIAG